MNENLKYGAAAVAVVGLTVGAVLYFSRDKAAEPPAEPVATAGSPAAPAEPAIEHPLPPSDSDQALPALDDSGPMFQGAVSDLIGKEALERFIVTDDLIRHIVVTVDNLTEQKLAQRLRPIKRPLGEFTVQGSEEAISLDPQNFARYDAMVQVLRAVDTQRLVATYVRHFPLFQEAYESLGHPPEYFNDRLIQVIDVLLATPDVQGEIALAQPGVLYEYADPELESLTAGQKALIRMGGEHATAVKAKLRELRTALLALPAN